MPSEQSSDVKFEIGHVLFIDIVGYSKLLINEQSEQIQNLKEIVRGTEQFQIAEAEGKLLRLPTGDGGALVFRTSPEAPVLCALEITEELQKAPGSKEKPQLRLRMGIHSGPVNEVTDLNEQANIAGAGINIAQRVMDCGDAGHILLSKRIAEDLAQYQQWRSYLHDLGECAVKHGVRVGVVNLCTPTAGNAEIPAKIKVLRRQESTTRRRRSALVAAGLLLAVLLAVLSYKRISIHSVTVVAGRSIAVLPLQNLSEEKENAFFADGIQDELLANLAKIKDLKVISRTSVMQYKVGITRNLKEIAQQLGVANVVEGSVRRAGSHVRVTVQLIDAVTDRHLWSQSYDRTLADSITLQGELANQIATEVGATLSPQEKAQVGVTQTKNSAAYDAYLRGRAFSSGAHPNGADVRAAIPCFQEAVRLDSGFALAWAHLSALQSQNYWYGFDPTPAQLAAAKDSLDRALALDPKLPEAHLALGYYHYYGRTDFNGALAEFQRAAQDLPNNSDITRAIGLIQRRRCHWDEAVAAFQRSVELDPRDADSATSLALTYCVCVVSRKQMQLGGAS